MMILFKPPKVKEDQNLLCHLFSGMCSFEYLGSKQVNQKQTKQLEIQLQFFKK